MKLLVHGVSGFIGGGVARAASAWGHEVTGTARSRKGAGDWPFRVVPAESQRALTELIDATAPEVVLHAAGSASVGASMSAPREDFDACVLTWVMLLEAVRASKVRPLLLYPSSAAVYGNPASLPVREDAPSSPISPYGFHKVVAETLGREYASCFGLDVVVLRLFSVFGPAQRRLLLWELFEQLAGPGEVAFIQGTGRETRDFCHVDDVAAAALGIAQRRARGAGFDVVNVASGSEIEVAEVGGLLRDLVAPQKAIECRGIERPGDPRRWRADVARLATLAPGFQPRPFREALAACVAAWRASGANR